MRKGIALAALALIGCGRWSYDGTNLRLTQKLATTRDVPVGTDVNFQIERAGTSLVIIATTTRMCRRGTYGPMEAVLTYERTGLFGTRTRRDIAPDADYYDHWEGERVPCAGAVATPLHGRAVTVEGHWDALGDEVAQWTATTDGAGRAVIDGNAEGSLSWVSAFCGHGTLQVHAVPLPPETATASEPADTPSDPKVTEQGGLVTEIAAAMAYPPVDSIQWRYASRCRYGGVTVDPNVSAQAMALAGADTERAMALDACFVGVTSACRPACAAGDPLGCQLECQNGGGAGCDAVGFQVWTSDKVRAARYFAKGCEAGDANACWNLAGAVARGETGRAADPAAVLALQQKACTAGSAEGCQAVSAAAGGGATLARCDVFYDDIVVYYAQVCADPKGCPGGWWAGVECHANISWSEHTVSCLAEDGSTSSVTVRRATCDVAPPDPPEVTEQITPLVDDWQREDRITAETVQDKAPECPIELCHCWAQSVKWTGQFQPAC